MSTPWLSHLLLSSLSLFVLGFVALLLRITLPRDPSLRYRILVGGVIASLLAPWVQLAAEGRSPFRSLAIDRFVESIYVDGRVAPAPEFSPTDDPLPADDATTLGADSSAADSSAADMRDAPPDRAIPVVATEEFPSPAPRPIPMPSVPVLEESVPTSPSVARGPAAHSFGTLPDVASLAWVVYLIGAAIAILAHVRRLYRTSHYLRRCRPLVESRLLATWDRVRGDSNRKVRLFTSDEATTPACWGFFRPAIVIPSRDATGRGRHSLEWALLHELTHLERGDPAAATLQGFWKGLFWFHPVAIWISNEIDQLRELSCDQLVVEQSGYRKSYALALIDYTSHRDDTHQGVDVPHSPIPSSPLVPWSWGSPTAPPLKRRIEMLLVDCNRGPKGRRVAIGVSAALAVVAVSAAQITIAATFPSDDEVLVARCDPKKKAKKGSCPNPQPRDLRFQTPPPDADKPSRANENVGEIVKNSRGEWNPASIERWIEQRTSNVSDAPGNRPTPITSAPLDADISAALIKTLLHDKYSMVRIAAADALAPHVGEADVRRAFLQALKRGGDETVKATLLDALLRREPISSDLRDLLVDLCSLESDQLVRITVTDGLAPFAAEPEARKVLIESLLDDANGLTQMNAAKGLAPYVSDSDVQAAMIQGLLKSHNEIARMVMIDAIAPQLDESKAVRDLFVRLLQHDDNAVARMAIGEAMAIRADAGEVRSAMIESLSKNIDTTVKMTFAEALSPYAQTSDVKLAFIDSLRRIDDEVIRMTMVKALSGPNYGGWHRAQPARPAIYPELSPTPSELIPAIGQRY